jgi:transcriptional regulator with XRE-family HTH domain
MASPPKKKRPRLVNLTELGKRVIEARQKRGLNQIQLAELLGSAQGWLSELESGKHASMEVDTVRRLAETLGVSTDYLLGLQEKKGKR